MVTYFFLRNRKRHIHSGQNLDRYSFSCQGRRQMDFVLLSLFSILRTRLLVLYSWFYEEGLIFTVICLVIKSEQTMRTYPHVALMTVRETNMQQTCYKVRGQRVFCEWRALNQNVESCLYWLLFYNIPGFRVLCNFYLIKWESRRKNAMVAACFENTKFPFQGSNQIHISLNPNILSDTSLRELRATVDIAAALLTFI